jgi:2-isopropylmalate synthase
MKQIKISDVTIKQSLEGFSLSFKEKIELAKQLSRLGVDFIELDGIKCERTDALLIKSIATAVTESGITVPVELNKESVCKAWDAVRSAKKPRLQVIAPASDVQIEYLYHKKPDALISAVMQTVKAACELCPDVELLICDATRADASFLTELCKTGIEAGASTLTLCDTAGVMLPSELCAFIDLQYERLPALKNISLGIFSKNTISMADASVISAITGGASEIKAAAYQIDAPSLSNIAKIIAAKSDSIGACHKIRMTELSRIIGQIKRICEGGKNNIAAFKAEDSDDGIYLTANDTADAVASAITRLGYDLSSEDVHKAYASFRDIAERKERVSSKELEAIVASSTMQVPPTYKLDSYVITSGNTISATAHIKLIKNGEAMEGVYIGDGSIDAAFQAVEKITGCHYELDDFQLQAVTEGREAMGQTVVKLRAGGKLYSGTGISTDIVGAGILAYISALNKIIYEEQM